MKSKKKFIRHKNLTDKENFLCNYYYFYITLLRNIFLAALKYIFNVFILFKTVSFYLKFHFILKMDQNFLFN